MLKQRKKTGASVSAGQRLLNGFGFTDRMGKSLKEDGVLGVNTSEALGKLKRYQEELEKPSAKTRAMQTELNKSGRKYLDGKPLKVDGIFGPKTDYVKNAVDNDFTGWLMDENYKERTLPTKVFPRMPKIGKAEVDNLVKGNWAELPDLSKQPTPEKHADLPWEQKPESAFEKATKTLEHRTGKEENPFSLKSGGQKTMERTLPNSYIRTQKEKDDASELQALIEKAAGMRKNGTKTKNMVYNMGKENVGKAVQMSNASPQPTQPPGEEKMPTTPEEMSEYLKAHPEETINGINAERLGVLDQAMQAGRENGFQLEAQPEAAPEFLRNEEDMKAMQKALGVGESGKWDADTQNAYKERMDGLNGMLYQDQPEIKGLPFDQNGMEANGCSTTATHNVLQLMGKDVPYEQTYSWHREHEDRNFPGTVPWRTEEYLKEMVPDVKVRNASTAYAMVVPETKDTTPMEARAQKVISEDGYGIMCVSYQNPDGSIGAHYVALEADPDTGGVKVYDYEAKDGKRVAGAQSYPNVHDYMKKWTNGMVISAWGLSPK